MWKSRSVSWCKVKCERKMPFSVTTPPVKRRLERPAGRDKRKYKNKISAEDAQSETEGILNCFVGGARWLLK